MSDYTLNSRQGTIHKVAVTLCVLTFMLIVWGGHVKTTGSGMAFPSWPSSNGERMFEYAPSKWMAVPDRFWEHGHRLFASVIGLVATILLVITYRGTPKESRPHPIYIASVACVFVVMAATLLTAREVPGYMIVMMAGLAIAVVLSLVRSLVVNENRRLIWLAMTAFLAVCLQGLFGGFAVHYGDQYFTLSWAATVHGVLAEIFFMIIIAIALLSSTRWLQQTSELRIGASARMVITATWALTFLQFILGAITRHLEAWLHSSSFPEWNEMGFFPSGDEMQVLGVTVHIIHRTMAYLVAVMIVLQALAVHRHQIKGALAISANAGILLVVVQIVLGAGIVLSGRDEIITTLHVMVGVVLMAISNVMMFTAYRSQTAVSDAIAPRPSRPIHAGGQY